jgi:Carbohydrate-selective porin, OprB family/S-layer homology domain
VRTVLSMDMNKFWLSALVFAPLVAGASFVSSDRAIASEVAAEPAPAIQATPSRNRGMSKMVPVSQLEGNGSSPAQAQASNGRPSSRAAGQVTSVSQLSDVQPTDWAFQALQSLVERYGCIAGYPNGTYRGNRALTRYEFAAGLNACMNRIEELISSATADIARKEDLEAMVKLQEEFATELAAIRGQVDGLEARLAVVESQQFSTTTKLQGEIVFGLAGLLGDETAITSDQQRALDSRGGRNDPRVDVPENTIFANRTRLNFDASFTGKDRLRVRLQAANVSPFSGGTTTGTNQTRLSYDGAGDTAAGIGANDIQVQRLEYRFPVGERVTVFVEANAGEFNDNMYTFSPLESSARGSVSRFGRFNPIYRTVAGGSGTGATADFKVLDGKRKLTLSAGYFALSSDAADPTEGNGLFNGSYSAVAQLRFQPATRWNIGLTYVRSFARNGSGITGSTGTTFANNPFSGVSANVNSFGLQTDFKVFPKFIISGWAGYNNSVAAETRNRIGTQGTAADPVVREGEVSNSLNWAVQFGFPDVLKQGSLAGIVVGQPPYVTYSEYGPNGDLANKNQREDRTPSWHFEGFYRYPINDNIDITPGLFVILNPEGNNSNDTIYVGTVRTTFRF